MKTLLCRLLALLVTSGAALHAADVAASPRERTSLNADWRFTKDDPVGTGDTLSYPKIKDWLAGDGRRSAQRRRPAHRAPRRQSRRGCRLRAAGVRRRRLAQARPAARLGHRGPFKQEYPGETGKLPWWGVAWYRKHFSSPADDAGKHVYLDVDGAMACASVWLNGQFVGGWPYGYSSWRVDLTPFLKTGADNILAIRLDNPPNSSRWYPGGGIYRNVWLVKTAPVHVAQWGTFITTPLVAPSSATVDVKVTVENDTTANATVAIATAVFALDAAGNKTGDAVATTAPSPATRITAGRQVLIAQSIAWRRRNCGASARRSATSPSRP